MRKQSPHPPQPTTPAIPKSEPSDDNAAFRAELNSFIRNILDANPILSRFYADSVIDEHPNSRAAKILRANYQKIVERTSMGGWPALGFAGLSTTEGAPSLAFARAGTMLLKPCGVRTTRPHRTHGAHDLSLCQRSWYPLFAKTQRAGHPHYWSSQRDQESGPAGRSSRDWECIEKNPHTSPFSSVQAISRK